MNLIQEQVTQQRRRLGMTQRELAAKLGWSEGTLSRRLNNPGHLKLNQAQELAEALGLTLSALLSGGLRLRDVRSLVAVAS